MKPYAHVKSDFLDVLAKPWVQIERIRSYLQKSSNVKIMDLQICEALGLPKNALSSYKSRTSSTFSLYVVKWCLKNNLDIKEFIEL